jgi:hypothetical protein
MSMSRDRPTFVLPWIVVVLAVFAFLPPWMGRLVSDPVSTLADAEADAPVELDPMAHTAGLDAESVDQEERSYSEADGAKLASEARPQDSEALAAAASVDPATAEVSEAGFQPEVETPAQPIGGPMEEREFQSLTPTAILVGGRLPVEAPSARRGLARSAVMHTPADSFAALQEHAQLRSDGRMEIRLSMAALNFLRQEGLLPTEVPVIPAAVEAVAREMRRDSETLEEPTESKEAGRKRRLKAFLRKMRSNPRQAAAMLLLLKPAQLMYLAKQLDARGIDPRALLLK